MPWVAASPESNAVAVPSAAEGTPEQPLTDNQSATSAPAQMTQQNEATAPQQETPALPPVAEEGKSRRSGAKSRRTRRRRQRQRHRRSRRNSTSESSRGKPRRLSRRHHRRRRSSEKDRPEAAARSHGASARDAASG